MKKTARKARTPSPKMTSAQVKEVSTQALKHIGSVPYRVSLRWVFYRLLQDGIYTQKSHYTKFSQLTQIWRNDAKNVEWRPDILVDDTRRCVSRGIDAPVLSKQDIIERLYDELAFQIHSSHFYKQTSYIELWFEARAMLGQFEEYTKDIVLRPFGGFAGIDYKYKIAKDLEKRYAQFQKPIKILYFGDCDDAGRLISYSSIDGDRGLRKWCNVPFKVIPCGLTIKQAQKYKLPSNIKKDVDNLGEYQWESLSDEQAREIIEEAIYKYVDQDIIDQLNDEEKEMLDNIEIDISDPNNVLH